jgi:hypothetical protein
MLFRLTVGTAWAAHIHWILYVPDTMLQTQALGL